MKFKKPIRSIIIIIFSWVILNIALVLYSWGKSYFVDYGARPVTLNIDKRKNTNQKTHIITFVATQAEPEKYWLFGHLWVWFDETPSGEPKGTFQYGYYSQNKTHAAIELVKSIFNPLGFYYGQKPVLGQIQFDDPWPHHLELKVLVDEDTYKKAIITHQKWRKEKEYFNRPKWGEKSKGCQDYAYDIAQTIGLEAPSNHYGEFPPESFIKLAKINGVEINAKPSFGNYLSKIFSVQ